MISLKLAALAVLVVSSPLLYAQTAPAAPNDTTAQSRPSDKPKAAAMPDKAASAMPGAPNVTPTSANDTSAQNRPSDKKKKAPMPEPARNAASAMNDTSAQSRPSDKPAQPK